VLVMAVCRFSNGYALIALVMMGMGWALLGKVFLPLFIYAFLMVCVVTSQVLLPKEDAIWSFGLRGGVLGISCAMIVGASRRTGGYKLPLGTIAPFLLSAVFSLYDSWVPQISALKLIQFSLFLLGIWKCSQNMHRVPVELMKARALFFAIAMFFVIGSAASYPFPSVSYALNLRYAIKDVGVKLAVENFLENSAYIVTLFCGVTNQSQALAPILAIVFSWVACDMLFVEKRFRWLHVLLLILTPPMIYMTRSRVGLVTLLTAIITIYFYTAKKIVVSDRTRKYLIHGMFIFISAAIIGGTIMELKDNTISRWLRKTEDVKGDTRSLTEAMTTSRQGLVEMCWEEFKRNPFVGSGFQVAWYSKNRYEDAGGGLVLSSSIEKGVLPLMVLGETGVVGFSAFVFFLITFFVGCSRRRYYVTITMFVVLLVSNLGEATFFSPGGLGGIEWAFCAVGGFVIDTMIAAGLNARRQ